MRAVAAMAPASALLGSSDLDDAVVDGWLSFVWSSIDLPLQVLASGTANAAIKRDFTAALAKVEAYLQYRTYMVGHGISLADISLAISLREAGDLYPKPKEGEVSNLFRWYSTVLEQVGRTKPSSGSGGGGDYSGVLMNGVPPPVVNKMYRRHRIRIKEVLKDDGAECMDQTITVAGWARTTRNANKGQLLFVELNDGSTGNSLQCVLSSDTTEGFEECKNSGGTGASFQMVGKLIASQGGGQAVELQVTTGKLLGAVYGGDVNGTTIGGKLYAMSKKAHTLEHMREHAHLRPRARLHSSVMRIRHAMAYATHTFFNNHGFLYIHTPIITGADCEGAGEQFGVTTLLGSDHLKKDVKLPIHEPPPVSIHKFKMSRLKQSWYHCLTLGMSVPALSLSKFLSLFPCVVDSRKIPTRRFRKRNKSVSPRRPRRQLPNWTPTNPWNTKLLVLSITRKTFLATVPI